MVRRRDLLAYLIGAGVAGTVLSGRTRCASAASACSRAMPIGNVPFFLLPILWGAVESALGAPAARGSGSARGARCSGFVAAVGVNLLFLVEGAWFPAAIVLPAFLPVVYFLLCCSSIGPLNEALGVESSRCEG